MFTMDYRSMHENNSYIISGPLATCIVSNQMLSGVARPSGLGGHTYRWFSAVRLGEYQKKATTSKAEDANL